MKGIKLPSLKGKDKYETWENYTILFILVGAVILSSGIGLTAISQKGVPAILAIFGSFITFISTIVLILIWLVKSFKGE
ncbi:MAG: hypothetical protein QXQ18_00065 [Candidatus Aenigmatarchaeota archaeon]